MEVGRYRSMMTNEVITVGGNSYEQVKPFKYLQKNQNSIHKEIQCRPKAGNLCYENTFVFSSSPEESEN
jgi:hypothetical protein